MYYYHLLLCNYSISLLQVSTLSATPISYYCPNTIQQLLRLLLTGTLFSYFYQLLLFTPISYSYQLLVSESRYYLCESIGDSLVYQLLLQTSHFSCYLPPPPPLRLNTRKNKKNTVIGIFHSLSFLFWFIVLITSYFNSVRICGPYAYAFNMIGK